jgi:NAD(P)-dependent dehydrogenase (short-subunit alcohol dehydrogenase family)
MTPPPPRQRAAILGRPEEVAQVVRFLVVEAPDYLTGEFINLRGGRL